MDVPTTLNCVQATTYNKLFSLLLFLSLSCKQTKREETYMDWQQKAKKMIKSEILIQPFYILTITLFSLLLPLSVLLLSRFSSNDFFLSVSPPSPVTDDHGSFLLSVFLLAVLYLLVSAISAVTLINGLTGYKINLLTNSTISHPRLYAAWILLCTLQVSVCLSIEGSIAAGIFDGYTVVIEKSLLSRMICFLGLHETMLYWSRTVAKPVVDHTIFQGPRPEERWVQRVVTAAGFGTLWWWKLRDEVESLVIVPEAKIEMEMDVGVADLIGWWLYYVTVTIGMVRIVKFLMWMGMIFMCRRLRRNPEEASTEIEDKA